jgi:hypothetical protein
MRARGHVQAVAIDAPYLSLTPVVKVGKVVGYLVAPGGWLGSYEANQQHFLANVPSQLFHLHPRNDYLALRLGLFLTAHWRRHAHNAHTGKARQPICMADLLTASMIPLDKANLTSRFIPRIEAALQKLSTLGLLGEPPRNLTRLDQTKAQWGKDWLASYWHLVPPQP